MGLFNLFSRKAKKPTARREFSSSSYSSPTRRDGAFSLADRRRNDSSDDAYTPSTSTSSWLYDSTPAAPAPEPSSGGFFGHGGLFGGGGSSGDWGGGSDGGYSGGGDSGGGGDGGGGGGGDVTCNIAADPMFNRHRNWRLTI